MEPSRGTLRAIIANVVFKNLFDAKSAAPAVLPDYPLSPHLRRGPAASSRNGAAAAANFRDMDTLLSDTLTAGMLEGAGFRPRPFAAAEAGTRATGVPVGTAAGADIALQSSTTAGSGPGVPAVRVHGRPSAAVRRRDISRCRVLRGAIHKFEEEYLDAHGERPHGVQREPLAGIYAEYRLLKQTVRGECAT
jgi:hypothetical protein